MTLRFGSLTSSQDRRDRRALLLSLLAGGVTLRATAAEQGLPAIPAEDAQVRLTLLRTLSGHTAPVGIGISLSPDASILASAAEDRTVRVWRTADGDLLRMLPGHSASAATAAAISPDGKHLAAPGADTSIRIWNVDDWSQAHSLPGSDAPVYYSPDGRLLAARGSTPARIDLWDPRKGRLVGQLEDRGAHFEPFAFSRDGKLLAAGGLDGVIRIWKTSDGSMQERLTAHPAKMRAVAFSPDGKTLASSAEDRVLRIWSLPERTVRLFGFTDQYVTALAFSPDGKLLVGGAGEDLFLWRAPEGLPLGVIRAHGSWINALAFSRDGTLLATGSRDRHVKLWKVERAT